MTQHNAKQPMSDEILGLIAQLPAEMQEKLNEPAPTNLNNFLEMVSDLESLRYNILKLVVEHQRNHKLDWQDEDYEDFYLLSYFLETQQYSR